jgi:hypothetical protein
MRDRDHPILFAPEQADRGQALNLVDPAASRRV